MSLEYGPEALPEVQTVCRWQNQRMLKVYLDVVGATASALSKDLEKVLKNVANEAQANHYSRLVEALEALPPLAADAKQIYWPGA
jgi:hypothetical protein